MSRIELPPKWKWTTLGELATSVKNGIYVSRPGAEPNGIPILRIGAVRPMHLSLDDLRYTGMSLAEVQRNDGLARPGDLLFTRYSGNPRLVGACARVPDHSPTVAYPDKLIRVVLPVEEVDSRFISYAWISSEVQAQVRSQIKTTAGQTGISGSSLKSIRLPLPPLAEQRRIAQVLGHADAVRAKRRTAITLLDDLAQSIFHDMFGNVVTNDRRWDESLTLGEVADICSGVTKGRKAPGSPMRTVPYMTVLNVQERRLNLAIVKTIEATEVEISRYRLIDNDLLLTEGGDPDKLGRGTLWQSQLPECIHQNHIFRVRLHRDSGIEPIFLNWLVASERGRGYFLRSAKQTTGIASINATQLKQFPLLTPPITIQHNFVRRLSVLEQHKMSHVAHLAELDALFASVQHRAFRGDLWDTPAA